jgi:hypothetical protein
MGGQASSMPASSAPWTRQLIIWMAIGA